MKDILNDLMSLNLVLKLEKMGCQLQITVSTDDYKFFSQQCLPRDDHMDYALEGCIRFCINKTLERKNQAKPIADEGFYS
jgi:hypothetical protein